MLQTRNTACARSASATLGLPLLTARVASLPNCSGFRLFHWEPSVAGPGLQAPPRSKTHTFRHSGSPQRCRLGWACILCHSQVRGAQVMRCLASVIAETYHLPATRYLGVKPVHLLRQMLTVQTPKKF